MIPKQRLQKVPKTRMCCLTACILYLTTACIGIEICYGASQSNINVKKQSRKNTFSFFPERAMYGKAKGMAMVCPAHRHGTLDQAIEKLHGILEDWPLHLLSSSWVCRANQIETLKRIAPLVDRVFINPFVHSAEFNPKTVPLTWPEFDHPCINHIRRIVENSAKNSLIACIDLNGEPNHFKKRKASFEEIRWMVYSVIGAGFKGVVWRGSKTVLPWIEQINGLERDILHYAKELGESKPISWVKVGDGQACSALCTGNKMFVVLLNPNFCGKWDCYNTVTYPIEDKPCFGTIKFSPPPGITILSGAKLSGVPVRIIGKGNELRAEYKFTGGGEIIIFQLSSHTTDKFTATSKPTSQYGRKGYPTNETTKNTTDNSKP